MHVYILVESLSLTAAQRTTLVQYLRSLGPSDDPQPCRLNHARVRPDNLALIVEAEFDEPTITAAAIGAKLAAIFGASQASVTYTTAAPTFGEQTASEQVTYRYDAVDRVRLTIFGGRGASWEVSRGECAAYLLANLAAWGETSA